MRRIVDEFATNREPMQIRNNNVTRLKLDFRGKDSSSPTTVLLYSNSCKQRGLISIDVFAQITSVLDIANTD